MARSEERKKRAQALTGISPRDQQKALEAEKILDELVGSIPDRKPFREVRARLLEALIAVIAEGRELPAEPSSAIRRS